MELENNFIPPRIIKKILKHLYLERCQQGLVGVARVSKLFQFLTKTMAVLGCIKNSIWYLHRYKCPRYDFNFIYNPVYQRKRAPNRINLTEEEFKKYVTCEHCNRIKKGEKNFKCCYCLFTKDLCYDCIFSKNKYYNKCMRCKEECNPGPSDQYN